MNSEINCMECKNPIQEGEAVVNFFKINTDVVNYVHLGCVEDD